MGDSSFLYAEFTPTRTRKNRKTKDKPAVTLQTLFHHARMELASWSWMLEYQSILRTVFSDLTIDMSSLNVVCLGLGSPSTSVNARLQLGFLLRLCEDFGISHRKVSVYDPVFTQSDVLFLEELQFSVPCNSTGSQKTAPPTVLFMPHCDLHLYEHIFRQHWEKECLANMVLIANVLGQYLESNPSHKLSSDCPCLSRIVPLLDCKPFPTWNTNPTAFNNTAVQYVPAPQWENLPGEHDFWRLPPHRDT
ncbi:hypothetical protein JAAARDRAFT_555598 [Jaapia argillacea MUCL 33604]|uniref:SRR1-like domain-containing protein n=1 Tax=Jaapia argillacea MUCL 33604 TaxID=933084 RepID=A0A067QDD2_9AGAM|nr:hypothetical protein JAAARDRAFT_555598 [Jaapia argillacea MUCL 33604]